MTRKDYEHTADVFRGLFREISEPSHTATISLAMKRMAEMFERDNPRFDRERFYAACTTY